MMFIESGDMDLMSLKYQFIPMGKNNLLVRLENIGDKFDTDTYDPKPTDFETTYVIDMHKMAKYLWDFANGEENFPMQTYNIVETTLTGNQEYKVMEDQKLKFKGIGDSKLVVPTHYADQAGLKVSVYQQAIRTFTIEYEPFEANFIKKGLMTEEEAKFLN